MIFHTILKVHHEEESSDEEIEPQSSDNYFIFHRKEFRTVKLIKLLHSEACRVFE